MNDLVAVKEPGGDGELAAWTLHREQLAIAEHLLDPAHRQAKPVSDVGNSSASHRRWRRSGGRSVPREELPTSSRRRNLPHPNQVRRVSQRSRSRESHIPGSASLPGSTRPPASISRRDWMQITRQPDGQRGHQPAPAPASTLPTWPRPDARARRPGPPRRASPRTAPSGQTVQTRNTERGHSRHSRPGCSRPRPRGRARPHPSARSEAAAGTVPTRTRRSHRPRTRRQPLSAAARPRRLRCPAARPSRRARTRQAARRRPSR